MSRRGALAFGAVLSAALPAALLGQSLERQIASAPDGAVQFHFAARDGVCGNGRNFYRTSESGGYYSSYSNGNGDESCQRGPVRAVVIRAGKEIVRIETYAGPLPPVSTDDGKDLGAVGASEAATWLLSMAATLEGRPARDAIQPAMLADSSVTTPQLTRIATDQSRSRDIRSTAISWLARRRAEIGGVGAASAQRTLDAIVRKQDENESTRRQALSALSNLDRAEGIPLLIAYAGESDVWIARQAMSSLANSGDPRARQFIRTALKRTDLAEETRTSVIRGIGNEYAVPADFRMLRELYPTLNNDQERNAVISTIGNAGGADNTTWLLELAKSDTEPASRRRQAVSALGRSEDSRVKEALRGIVVR